jgi:hypothetical protein
MQFDSHYRCIGMQKQESRPWILCVNLTHRIQLACFPVSSVSPAFPSYCLILTLLIDGVLPMMAFFWEMQISDAIHRHRDPLWSFRVPVYFVLCKSRRSFHPCAAIEIRCEPCSGCVCLVTSMAELREDGQAENPRIIPTLNLRWTFSHHRTRFPESGLQPPADLLSSPLELVHFHPYVPHPALV